MLGIVAPPMFGYLVGFDYQLWFGKLPMYFTDLYVPDRWYLFLAGLFNFSSFHIFREILRHLLATEISYTIFNYVRQHRLNIDE